MTETELECAVRQMLADRGLYGYHVPDSRRTTAGWPDWVIIGEARVLFRELKTAHGALSADQRTVGWMLGRAGQDWDVWRPSDLASGRIERELDALTPADG